MCSGPNRELCTMLDRFPFFKLIDDEDKDDLPSYGVSCDTTFSDESSSVIG